MENRIYYKDLECYDRATPKQLQALNKKPYYDLEPLPTDKIRAEFASYIWERGRTVGIITIKAERNYFNSLCRFLEKWGRNVESLLDRDTEQWIRQLKGWMMQEGRMLTRAKVSVYGKPGMERAALIRYFHNVLEYIQPEDERDETEKDIWNLKKLNIEMKYSPIKNVETINFKKITQPDIREEVKKAIFYHLRYETIATIQREMSVMRKFSGYLKNKFPDIASCQEIDRALIEKYLIYIKVEKQAVKGNTDDLLKLRNVLESVGKIYGYTHLESLFLSTDFPKVVKAEFKVYSDEELKRLNAHITKMDEQIARCMVIHQMLGNRISDTLTLRRNCLFEIDGQDMITIHQVKTRTFEKPISRELAMLIQKAIEYTAERFGETKYIFVDEKNPEKPLQYGTLECKVMAMITRETLCDDQGKPFGFNTHMFRHYYGVKLTEMHLDDWTIAKLLGHKDVRSVRYYRRMSNQVMADETREARRRMSDIIMENLEGWGEEYEKIRQDD